MKDNKTEHEIVIGIALEHRLDVYQILFIVLKVFNVIDWSWWIVLIPLWIGIVSGLLDAIDARCTNK